MLDIYVALAEPLLYSDVSCRAYCNVLRLLCLLLGFGFALLLSSMSCNDTVCEQHFANHELTVAMTWEPPKVLQFRWQASTPQFLQLATVCWDTQHSKVGSVLLARGSGKGYNRVPERQGPGFTRALRELSKGFLFRQSIQNVTARADVDGNISQAVGKGRRKQCKYAGKVQLWADRVIIGLNLCPWAVKAQSEARIKYITYEGNAPSDVAKLVWKEARLLTSSNASPLSTTLIVCPHVAAWKEFNVFNNWVSSGTGLDEKELKEIVALVPFHPKFLEYRALAEGIKVGSIVQSYYPDEYGDKSHDVVLAKVTDTRLARNGELNLIGMCFLSGPEGGHDHSVPVEWVMDSEFGPGPSLPKNAMYHAPYPTIHLIRQTDIFSVGSGQLDKVVTRNAELIDELGWKGMDEVAKGLNSTVAPALK